MEYLDAYAKEFIVHVETIELTMYDFYFLMDLLMYRVVSNNLPMRSCDRDLDYFIDIHCMDGLVVHDGVIHLNYI